MIILSHLRNQFKDSVFKRLYLKNWTLIFLCIVLPLVTAVFIINYVAQKNLLKEVDSSAIQNTININATLESIFSEAVNITKMEIMDQDTTIFLHSKYMIPPSYAYITLVNRIMERISIYNRNKLYYSVNILSEDGEFLISSRYNGQMTDNLSDKTILNCFEQFRKEQLLFAVPQDFKFGTWDKTETIIIYRSLSTNPENKSFVSVAIRIDELIRYLVDTSAEQKNTFYILDKEGHILVDSSGRKTRDQRIILPEEMVTTCSLDDVKVRLSWKKMAYFDMYIVQTVSMDEYISNLKNFRRTVWFVLIFGVISSVILAFFSTSRLFRPIVAIMKVLQSPKDEQTLITTNSETRYLLVQILELFQKNITLENRLIDRVSALKNARAKALQKQMTPHFLYNILNVINLIAIDETGNEESETSKAILLLADIIRTNKEQNLNLTSVKEEMEYTKKFVELEALRYGSDIKCYYRVDLQAEEMEIPCISIQTLVENSIIHGILPHKGKGKIIVGISKKGGSGLHIFVEDDGVGFDTAALEQIRARMNQEFIYTDEHIGIINLYQRFQLIYNEQCRFHIYNKETGGAVVEIDTQES